MSNIELKTSNLHWLEGSDPFEDCCLHGGVYLRIDDIVISDGVENDWTVSTTAFNLLKTLNHNHAMNSERPLIPHCGHTMWPIESEPDGLCLTGCDIGIDWSIHHNGSQLIHEQKDKFLVQTSLAEWKKAVCGFSDDVYAFFHTAWPKIIKDDFDRQGFELFMNLWQKYRAEADI